MAKPERIKPRHETVMDITEERIARVYAQAFLGVATKSPDLGSLVEQLKSLISDVLDKFPELEEVFRSALVAAERKEQIIDQVFGGRASTEVLNFLKVLARHGRLGLLRSVVRLVNRLYAEQQGWTDVQVRVAAGLDQALRQEIEDGLRRALGIAPVLHVTVDPSLIAGLVVRVGDRIYDGSLSTQFNVALKTMVERAKERIETRPQAFLRNAD